jgi:hypothetical protein
LCLNGLLLLSLSLLLLNGLCCGGLGGGSLGGLLLGDGGGGVDVLGLGLVSLSGLGNLTLQSTEESGLGDGGGSGLGGSLSILRVRLDLLGLLLLDGLSLSEVEEAGDTLLLGGGDGLGLLLLLLTLDGGGLLGSRGGGSGIRGLSDRSLGVDLGLELNLVGGFLSGESSLGGRALLALGEEREDTGAGGSGGLGGLSLLGLLLLTLNGSFLLLVLSGGGLLTLSKAGEERTTVVLVGSRLGAGLLSSLSLLRLSLLVSLGLGGSLSGNGLGD